MKTNWLALTALLIAPALYAAEKPTFTTVETAKAAGPDYDLQGEYTDVKNGAHVIAMSDGKYQIVLYRGGLPGKGWDKKTPDRLNATAEGDKIVYNDPDAPEAGVTVEKEELIVRVPGTVGTRMKKVYRASPTIGAKPPAGAVVLFDGSNADAWEKGHMDDRKLLESGFKTKASFTNYTLHVEFILPFKPHGRGQDRGNSGVYMQDRYEVQVLDSFGLKGENNECGGIYTKAKPLQNMCFPPLTWQTYDIDFTAALYDADGKKTNNAVITVKHNDVVIHDKFKIDGSTGGGKKEDPTGGQIQLQGHGNPVFYRNIWILPLQTDPNAVKSAFK